MGTVNCKEDPLHVLEEALQSGISMFQLREKGEGALVGEALEAFARKCQQLCATYNVPFIMNDEVELALKIQTEGVHIGQEDTRLVEIREKFHNKIIGVSVHTKEEMEQAIAGGANYVGVGPIFATQSKDDAKVPAGVAFLQEARTLYPNFPIVAIGGITVENAHETRQAGADGVAVISTICQSKNRQQTIDELKGIFLAQS